MYENVARLSCAIRRTGVKMIDIGAEFSRIQEMLNEWCELSKQDQEFFPKNWALEKLWMDVEILKAAVFTFWKIHGSTSSSNHDEDPESP